MPDQPQHTLQDLLAERGGTHGHWPTQAEISESLWLTVSNADREGRIRLTASQAQALHMICTKLGRIAVGNPDEVDHWRDIAGYATLAADEMEAKARRVAEMSGSIIAQTEIFPRAMEVCPGCGALASEVHGPRCTYLKY